MKGGREKVIVMMGLLVACMLLFRCPEWLHSDAWHVAFLHHFFHVNIFHLAVNCLSLWLMFRNPSSRLGWGEVVTAYVIASLSWFTATADVAGASNFIYALIGLRTPPLDSPWWKARQVRLFLVVTVIMAVFPQVSAVTHVTSFCMGCMAASVSRFIKSTGHDLDRVTVD